MQQPATRFAVALLLALALAPLRTAMAAPAGRGDIPIGPDLIPTAGYPLEYHYAHTADAYVLQMWRMPRPGAPPVFLQHGLLDSASTWVVNPPPSSLAFLLFDAGYDVWLGNSRGNTYSTNSTNPLCQPCGWPLDGCFWSFSFHDMARYDVPAQIGKVLKVVAREGRANHTRLAAYIGHSQGTTQMFANLATDEWSVANEVALFVALAPVARTYHTGAVLIKAAAAFDIDKLIALLGVHRFLPTSALLRLLMPAVCDATPVLCEDVIRLFAGLDLGDLNQTRLDVYTSNFPSGTSVQDMAAWADLVRNDEFWRYNYGLLGNLAHYGQATPPLYDLTRIRTPTALFYGGRDTLADPIDVKWLLTQLAPATLVDTVFIDEYAHMDFVWGEHAAPSVFQPVIELIRKYGNSTAV